MTHAFWTGGAEEYVKGIHQHYEPRIAALKKRLESASRLDGPAIHSMISKIEADYQSELDAIDGETLF